MRLSAKERRLLDFARERFGEHLSQFLQAGLGEEEPGQRWRFTIKYTDHENSLLRRQVEVITYEPLDGSSYLPRGRDPLVLLSFFQLLLQSNKAVRNSLKYRREDILNLLGWKNTVKIRKEIDEAVNRYSLLTYKWKMNKRELALRNLSFFTCTETIIPEYQITHTEGEDEGVGDLYNLVVFSEPFIEQLLRRSLFQVDWNSVRSFVRSSSP